MENAFITQYFDWNGKPSWKVRAINAVLAKLGSESRLVPPRATGEQTNVEQRMNLFHLASQVLAYGVPGDVVEIGTHKGSSAVLLRAVIDHYAPQRELHVYDAFVGASPDELLANFERYKLRPPAVHAGWFRDTLPRELPDRVAFAHCDVGWGQPAEALEESVRLALASVYPRMPRGAILVFADYCDPQLYERPGYTFPRTITNRALWNLYPPVRKACDAFFADKPETMAVLYSGHYSHGYVRKL